MPDNNSAFELDRGSIGLGVHKMHKFMKLGSFEGMQEHFYFNKCQCNELKGAVHRHCPAPREVIDVTTIKQEFSEMVKFVKTFYIDPRKSQHAEVMEQTRAKIKARYKKAYYNLKNNRIVLSKKLARAQAFVKYEKMKINKIDAPPRLIQYRSFEFLYLMKAVFLPFVLFVKSCKEEYLGQKFSTYFTSGLNQRELGNMLYDSWSDFENPVAICLDHSMFDGSISVKLKRLENWFFSTIIGMLSGELLDLTVINRVFSQCGLRWKGTGMRLSGEFITAIGNSVINIGALLSFLHEHNITKHRVHVCGDDSIIIIEEKDIHKIDLSGDKIDWFLKLNFTTKLDRVCRRFSDISYCQCCPLRIDGEWVMIKDPIRTMSRILYCDAKFEKIINRFVSGTMLCELVTSSRVPIVGHFCRWFLSKHMDKPLGSVDKTPAQTSGFDEISFSDISLETRNHFQESFGITVDEQLSIEAELAGKTTNSTQLFEFLYKYKAFHKN